MSETQKRLFIGYSHKDVDWLERVLTHLAILRRQGQVVDWSDKEIQPGDRWNDEIAVAMGEADVAVLLVSSNFLASEYIMRKELPGLLALLNGESPGRLRRILPLILEPCLWKSIPALKELEVRPKGRELSAGNEHQRQADLADFAQQVTDLLFAAPSPAETQIAAGGPAAVAILGASGYATLELGISHCEWNSYRVELGFTWSGDRSGDFVRRYGIRLDLGSIASIEDAETYARELSRVLFPDQEVRDAIVLAKTRADEKRVALRVRICIDPSARELHSLNWEKLTACGGPDNPFAAATTVFGRCALGYGRGARAALIRRRVRPTALLLGMAAGPAMGNDDGAALQGLDTVAQLLGRAGIACTVSKCWHEIAELTEVLRQHDGFDYAYFLARDRGTPEGAPEAPCNHAFGDYTPMDAASRGIITALDAMERPPRLLIVVPEQPDGPVDALCWRWFLHLAHQVVEGGVLGVLTLQGALDEASWRAFLAPFFGGLIEHGLADQAARSARGAIAAAPNPWAPALVSRMRSARLWYEPHLMNETRREETWQLLIKRIAEDRCTPIVGPGVDYRVARFRQDISLQWADRYQYPLARHEQVSLAQVAQYVAATRGDAQMENDFIDDVRGFALRRYGHLLDGEERKQPLVRLLSVIAEKAMLKEPDDSHVLLAGLPFSAYVTANFNNFLAEALRRSQRPPQELVFNADVSAEEVSLPSPEHPLVYHLFGRLDDVESLVLTEDDYFDFLIDFWREHERIPAAVRRALASSSLLFLGFNLHQWDFRVLFRSLLKEQSSQRRRKQLHIAVQVDPDDDQITNPDRAREYLEAYFEDFADSDVNIYWGSSEDFLCELQRRWQARSSS
ncbi:MAG: SIR2 family protein [Candidatus Accumulibacter sp.]|uniref:SIR2 family protein n=1 Tax=Candidatus Accumulibacter affinis TaxID=2954384 RepID=A0A935TDZ9_9PROT|nr:SIR2 family protein [Candidatus Accumulibacter affinis]